ncbi:PE-PGRS family protein [Kutzneria sp. 744]|nr:PE-PGRS family protein [Kutzneria sp. 744]
MEQQMDEVETMTEAGAKAGEAVGRAVRAARRQAARAGQAGIEKTHELVDFAGEEFKPTRKAARRMAKQARRDLQRTADQARKDLKRTTGKARAEAVRNANQIRKQARKVAEDLADTVDPRPTKRRRRWPWLVGLVVAGGATAVVVLSRRPREVRLQDVREDPPGSVHVPEPARNGHEAPKTADKK